MLFLVLELDVFRFKQLNTIKNNCCLMKNVFKKCQIVLIKTFIERKLLNIFSIKFSVIFIGNYYFLYYLLDIELFYLVNLNVYLSYLY